MKYFIQMLIAFSLLLNSCRVNKASLKTEETNSIYTNDQSFNSVYNPSNQNIAGTWTMTGIDSYGSLSDSKKEPAIMPGDIIWDFAAESDAYGALHVMGHPPASDLQEKRPHKSAYWIEDCLLQLDHKKYIYRITEIHDQDGKVIARELTLRDNLDISIADGGSTMRFRSMDAYFACGTTGGEKSAKPQLASLINGIVMQAYMEEEKVEGAFKLFDYQAYTSSDRLPDYVGEQVIWKFGDHALEVTKENESIKNDYSLEAGQYSVWKDRCLMQIGPKIYYYEMQEVKDENGNIQTVLHLNSGTEPNIADEEQHFYFIKL